MQRAASAYRGHAVNHVVLSLGMPCAVNLCVGFVRPWGEGEDSKRSLIVGYKETVSARNVFLSINPARIPVGPLSRIPMRPHERAGMHVRPLDELEVGRGSDSNLRAEILTQGTYSVTSPLVILIVERGSN